MNELNRENFPSTLTAFLEEHRLVTRSAASAIGCSEPTLKRLLACSTLASDEMLRQAGIMLQLGFRQYSTLTNAERKNLSEAVGAISGGAVGFSTITAAISSMGSIAGLSGAGIMSGLGAIGGVLNGGAAIGVLATAAFPLVGGLIGLGIVKSLQYAIREANLDSTDFDPKWEMQSSH